MTAVAPKRWVRLADGSRVWAGSAPERDDGPVSAGLGNLDMAMRSRGYVAWTGDLRNMQTQVTPTSQEVRANGVWLPAGITLNRLHLSVWTAGAGTVPTNFWGLVYRAITASRADLVAQSPDSAAAVGFGFAGTQKFIDFAAPYVTPAAGLYYFAALQNGLWGTTQMRYGISLSAGGTQGGGHPVGPPLAWSKTGQATPPASVTAFSTVEGTYAWVGAS